MALSVYVETLSGSHELPTNRIISFNMSLSLCNASGTATLVLADVDLPTDIRTYDVVTIYNSGDLNQTFYISNINKAKPDHVVTLTCEASTKRLSDYWIDESMSPKTPITTTRYWIDQILGQTGVDYSFLTASDGELVQQDSEMGYMDAKSAVTPLLQQSGWYMTFGPDGTIYIGKIAVDADPALTLEDEHILDLKVTDHDKMYRNRAVVWGKANPITSGWVFADITRHTSADYDNLDLRTVVISNHLISENNTARAIAKRLLDEFAKTDHIVSVTTDGFANVSLADKVAVNSAFERFTGIVTTYNYTIDSSGEVTNLILNERCPRIIGGFDGDGYVYIGTTEDGVWRKPLRYIHTWTDYSQGLVELDVSDLSIANGVFATVAGEVLYSRYEGDAAWTKVTLPTLTNSGITYPSSSGVSRSCSVSHTNSTIYAGINLASGITLLSGYLQWNPPMRSWLLEKKPGGARAIPVQTSGEYGYDYLVIDVESYDQEVILSTLGMVPIPETINIAGFSRGEDGDLTVLRENRMNSDNDTYTRITSAFNEPIVRNTSRDRLAGIFYNNKHFAYTQSTRNYLYRYDVSSDTSTSIQVDPSVSTIRYGGVDESIVLGLYNPSNGKGVKVDFGANSVTDLFDVSYAIDALNSKVYVKEVQGDIKSVFLYLNSSGNTLAYRLYNATTNSLGSETTISELSIGIGFGVDFFEFPDSRLFIRVTYDYSYTRKYAYVLIDLITGTYSVETYTYGSPDFINDFTRYTAIVDYTEKEIVFYRYFESASYKITVAEDLSETKTATSLSPLSGEIRLITGKVNSYVALFGASDLKIYDYPGETLLWTISGTTSSVSYASDDIDGGIYLIKGANKKEIIKKLPDGTETVIVTTSVDMYDIQVHGRRIIASDYSGIKYVLFDNDPTPEVVTGDKINYLVGNKILKYANGTFEYIYGAYDDTKVEMSKGSPVVLYGGVDFTPTVSGVVVSGGMSNFGYLSLAQVAASGMFTFFPLIGRTPNFNYNITDARVFDLVTESGVSRCIAICQPNLIDGNTALGLIDTDYVINGRASYVTESGSGTLVYSGIAVTELYPFQYADLTRWVSFSGVITNFETSNLADSPYMFVGIMTTGSGVDFYQKDAYDKGEVDGGFIQRINNIPSSNITVIRVDDAI